MVDLRRAPRFDASAIPSLKSARQVGGAEIKLINISRRGALIEIEKRLLPGTDFSMQLVIAETVHLIYGRIIRCYVSAVDKMVQYRCAIAFDEDFAVLPSGEEGVGSGHTSTRAANEDPL